MVMMPTFIDFEASSLSAQSYPIEVAWTLDNGSIESHLISPEGIDGWTDWDVNAQKVHGITREDLIKHGRAPSWVCHRIKEYVIGKTLYSDYPPYDRMWLAKLLSIGNPSVPQFEVANIDDLLIGIMCPEISGRSRALTRMVYMKFEARQLVPGQHRAGWDVQYLIELWKLACRYRDEVYGSTST